MCRILVIASLLVATFGSNGQDKNKEQDDAIKKILNEIHALEKKSESAPQVTGKQSAYELVLIAKISDAKNTFDGLLTFARKLREDATDETTKKVLSKYVDALETTARKNKVRLGEKDEIKKLIYALRDQRDFQSFMTDDPKSPAAKLLSIGKKAIPYLIDELGNDELTRSVSPEVVSNKKVVSPMYVVRVGDCANGILEKITGQQFGDSWYIHDSNAKASPKAVQDKAKKWWESQKQK